MNAKALFGILTIAAALAATGHAQIYQLSTPVTGSLTMGVYNLAGIPGYGGPGALNGYSSGTFNLNLTNLSETVYLDPVGGTLR
jgi:hypothetical protein